ncbi:MAG: methylenetetrahydrofolate reductase [Rhizobiales bacterium]|nr:methylenetetrahydrofolate reductase [Hyphomicrobiales bacterium]
MLSADFSLEATRPSAAEIAALADILPRGTPVYFSAVPTLTAQELVAGSALLRKGGLEPVVHIAARRIPAAADLQDLLTRLHAEADVRRLLVIGGDVDTAGAFPDALAVIQKGRLREAGIEEIGIAGYPEGHARIPPDRMEAALDQKIATARAAGLRVHIVSQFSFSPDAVVAWLKRLRACGIAVPVKVGMVGPTSLTALLRYAKRCGVNASLRGLASGAGAGLLGNVGPDAILAALDVAPGIGEASPHYFSFGGVLQTARYACDAAAGRIAVSHAMAQSNSA